MTLWILSVVVFIGAQVLPGSPGRAILGPYASPEVVDAVNEELGYNRPVIVRYVDWLTSALQGDFGESYLYKKPVTELIGPALANSLKLTAVALVLAIPISLIGGVYAAYRRGSLRDRLVTVGGMTLTVTPEFVTGIVLILVLGIGLDVLPITATPPANASAPETIRYLLMPAIVLMASLFGYVARVARAGTVEVLAADYTRTARGQGGQRLRDPAPARATQRPAAHHHRDHTRRATLGGCRHRKAVQLSGPGPADLQRWPAQGLRHPPSSCDADRDSVSIGDARRRPASDLLESPSARPGDRTMSATSDAGLLVAQPANERRRLATWELLVRSPAFLVGAAIFLFWATSAVIGPWVVPHDPYAVDQLNTLNPPSSVNWFGTDALGRDIFFE